MKFLLSFDTKMMKTNKKNQETFLYKTRLFVYYSHFAQTIIFLYLNVRIRQHKSII